MNRRIIHFTFRSIWMTSTIQRIDSAVLAVGVCFTPRSCWRITKSRARNWDRKNTRVKNVAMLFTTGQNWISIYVSKLIVPRKRTTWTENTSASSVFLSMTMKEKGTNILQSVMLMIKWKRVMYVRCVERSSFEGRHLKFTWRYIFRYETINVVNVMQRLYRSII